ncbi:MAG: SCP2 sterol-binding domain-containing protein [Quisquiliibacterium sp.]
MSHKSQSSSAAGLADKLSSVFGEAAGQAQRSAVQLLLAALEHLLEQQQWARERLRSHSGAGVRVILDLALAQPGELGELRFKIDDYGLLRAAGPQDRIDVTLKFQASLDAAFDLLRQGAGSATRHLRIDGDPALAATIAELVRYLRWEPEEDLSRLIGDAAAHRVVGLLRIGTGGIREVADRAIAATAGWAVGDQQQVATKPLVGWFAGELAALSERLYDLEGRLARVTGRPA